MTETLVADTVNAPPGDSRPDFSLQTVTSVQAFKAMQTEWNALLARSRKKCVFLTWEWQYGWWEHYASHERPKSLHIVAVRDARDELVAILPLYRQRTRLAPLCPLDLLRFIGSGFESSEYLDLICDAEIGLSTLTPLFDSLLRNGLDGLYLSDLRDDALLFQVLPMWAKTRALFVQTRYWKTCPFLPLRDDFEHYLESLSKNMRYNVRRRMRNLEKERQVVFRRIDDPLAVEPAVDTLFRLHRQRWDTRDGASKFDDPVREQFHQKVAGQMQHGGYLRFYLLEIDGQAAAALYCFNYDNHVYYYQAGMDPAWEKFSIGLVLMAKAIAASFAEGATEFDFLRGLESYKFNWTRETRDTFIVEIAKTAKARLCFSMMARWRSMRKRIKSVLIRFRKRETPLTP